MITTRINSDAHRRSLALKRIFECCPQSPYWDPHRLMFAVDTLLDFLATGRPVRIITLDTDKYRMNISED